MDIQAKILIEELEKITGKKVLFQENYNELIADVLRAAKTLISFIDKDFSIKTKNLARKHGIRIEAVEAMLKKDLINIINTKF
jgi:hypothetical protein